METDGNDLKLPMNVNEVATALGMSTRSVWRLSAVGGFPPPIAIGRCKRWRRAAIEAWLMKEERRALRQQKPGAPSGRI